MITTADEIINLQTGMRIRNTTEGELARCEVIYPSGDVQEYEGADADSIFDRAENIAEAAEALNAQLNKLTQTA